MISVYCHNLGRGGAEIAIIAIANLFAKSGLDVDFVTGAEESPIQGGLSAGISRRVFRTSRTLADLFPLAQYLREQKPKVLVSTLLRCNFVAWAASVISRYNGRLVFRETTLVYERTTGIKRLLVMIAYWLMAFRVDEVIVPSSTMLPGLAALSARYAQKARVVPNAVRSVDAPRTESRATHAGRALVVARLEPVKGVDLVLAAMRVSTACRKLDIYGDGSEYQSLRQLALDLGISDRVRLHGHVDSLKTIHSEGGVLVSASHFEGFPNAIVEALVGGLAVVIVGERALYSDLAVQFGLDECCFVSKRDPNRLAATLDKAIAEPIRFQAAPGQVADYVSGIDEIVLFGYLGSQVSSFKEGA